MSSTAFSNPGVHTDEFPFVRAPTYVNANAMGASSAASIPIPAGGQYLRLAGNLGFFVLFGSTGVTTAGSTAGVGSNYVPMEAPLTVNIGSTAGTTAISIISTAAAIVTQSWWTV